MTDITVCLPNKQAIFHIKAIFLFLNISPVTAQVTVMYFMAQSCLHIAINFLWPPEPDQKMPHFVPLSAASTEFRDIPRKCRNSVSSSWRTPSRALPYWRLDAKYPFPLPFSMPCGPPKFWGRTSSSITLSQVDLGRPGGLRQSGGGLWIWANHTTQLKIPHSTENCGP